MEVRGHTLDMKQGHTFDMRQDISLDTTALTQSTQPFIKVKNLNYVFL